MQILKQRPPVYDRIVKAIGTPPETAVYTYAPDIYAPNGTDLSPDCVIHESTHIKQQNEIGGAAIWWDKYLSDPEFRYAQELEAYRAQFAFVKARTKDRNARARALTFMAGSLAGKMYGSIVRFQEAYQLIQK